jgi:predicted nuclease of predicted toxin-antitoxin system
MAKFLANENVPADAVEAVRQAGHDLAWVREAMPGADDDAVLAHALAEGRVLVTFDKDFGELAFRRGKKATPGVLLLRPRLRAPEYVSQFLLAVLAQSISWEGHFCVAREGRLRTLPLPQ